MEQEIDQEIRQLEEELKKIDNSELSNYGSPQSPQKDSIFKFFREILQSTDSRKTGNLREQELGMLPNPVRQLLDVANYANAEGLIDVETYLKNKAEVILATSMSRKGFLAQLFVTQIKKEQKVGDPPPQKKGFFNFGNKDQGDIHAE